MALKIHLVNMPFANLFIPSIALAQLKAAVENAHGNKVSVRISYLNHEFARRIGTRPYEAIASGNAGHTSGLGEWLFRSAAFPELPDNTAEYLARYRYLLERESLHLRESDIRAFRSTLDELLDELILRYRIHEADVVGLTSMFVQNLPSIALAKRLRRISPHQTIVMGGANCEGSMGIELVTNVPTLDFVFSGMSLLSFPQFVGHLLDGEPERCHKIDGVFSRRNCRSLVELIENPADVDWRTVKAEQQLNGVALLGREQDINQQPQVEYDNFLYSLDHLLPEQSRRAHIPFETSRGCWWGERAHCTFCGLNGGTMAYRALHPERAVAMMNALFERYGTRAREFESVDNILPREYFDAVLPKLKTPDHARIFYEVKADLTEDNVRALARARVLRIQPGIEALATSTLKLMHKGTTAFHGLRLLRYCRKHQVQPNWNLLVGFPGETVDVYDRYIELLPKLFHLPPPIGVFQVRFDRFSPYFYREREYGLQLTPYDYYGLCYPFPAVAIRNMAYYFQDLNHEARYARDLAATLPELQRLTGAWQASWQLPERAPRLDLRTGPAGGFIDDTRRGPGGRHDLRSEEMVLLQRLEQQPVREDDLLTEQREMLPALHSRNLVFSERGRFMSLANLPPDTEVLLSASA
jgi:ribosomal peptide maturation radical SAM protein 1